MLEETLVERKELKPQLYILELFNTHVPTVLY